MSELKQIRSPKAILAGSKTFLKGLIIAGESRVEEMGTCYNIEGPRKDEAKALLIVLDFFRFYP